MNPLEPRLRHIDGWPVMSITAAPQEMELTVTNRGSRHIRSIDRRRWRMHLRFRPGTLVDVDRIAVAEQGVGNYRVRASESNEGVDLVITGVRPIDLPPGADARFRIRGLTPDARGGSRATRVEYSTFQLVDSADEAVTGVRLMHLSVLRRREPRPLSTRALRTGTTALAGPFLAGFAGGHALLNDGVTENLVRLRVVNESGGPLPVQTGDDDATRFTLGFRTGTALAPWGLLGSTTDHLGVTLADGSVDGWQIDHHTIRRVDPTPWRRGEALTLDLAIATTADIGTAQLILTFENVPGHDDDDLVLLADVGPIAADADAVRAVRPIQLRGPAASLTFHADSMDPDAQADLRLDPSGRLRVGGTGVGIDGTATLAGGAEVLGTLRVGENRVGESRVGEADEQPGEHAGAAIELTVTPTTTQVQSTGGTGTLLINPNGGRVAIGGPPSEQTNLAIAGSVSAGTLLIREGESLIIGNWGITTETMGGTSMLVAIDIRTGVRRVLARNTSDG